METFLPYNLNKAFRENDQNKFLSLGPYAKVLDDITSYAQAERNDLIKSDEEVYRGL